MSEVFGLALAIAASPFPVIPAILLLFTTSPRATSLAFLGGWFGGIVLVTGVSAGLAFLTDSTTDSPLWLSWVRIAVGVALVAYGVSQWRSRSSTQGPPKWMQSISEATPRKAVRLALLLSVANPKVLLLAVAGGLDIGSSALTATGKTALTLAFSAVASISVAIPVLTYAVAGDSVLPPLERAKEWLLRHNAAVMAVLITVIGLLLLKNGITGL